MRALLISIVLLSISFQGFAVSKLTASIDRNPVMEKEAFVLKVVADDSINTNDLDISALQSSGFIVGRTATGSQTQIINGSIEKSTTWSIVLVAKIAGKYTIPAFELNGIKSSPIAVEVIKPTGNNNSPNESLFIKNSLEETNLYVQQTVKLTSKLYISPQIELQSGSLTEPVLEGAFVQQQGKDKDVSEIVNGVRYRVIERLYTITPQASGSFTVQSPTFNGDVSSTNRRSSRFSAFAQSKPVTAFGEEFKITVKPIPDDYQGAWLPSSIVQLNEEWQPEKNTFEVGEAITRTITLTALNVNEEQLPEASGVYPNSFKIYPDQSSTHSVVRKNALVSQRISSEAIVANEAGDFVFPEVSVNWFNTITNRIEVASLPAKKIKIIPSKNMQQRLGDVHALPNTQSDKTQTSRSSLNNTDNSEQATDSNINELNESQGTLKNQLPQNTGQWIFFSSGWFAFIVLLVAFKRFQNSINKELDEENALENSPVTLNAFDKRKREAFKRACDNNDATEALKCFQDWMSIHAASQPTQELSRELKREVETLYQSKFSKRSPTSDASWQGQTLWEAVKQYEKSIGFKETADDDLPPLN